MASDKFQLEFQAEIGLVSSRKLASLDREHTVKFITQDPQIMVLTGLDPNLLVKVTVEIVA